MAKKSEFLSIGLDNNLSPYKIELAPLTRGLVVIGQSGSGKSFLLGRLLEEMVSVTTDKTRILVFDTNSDFCGGLALTSLDKFKDILIKYYSNSVKNKYGQFRKNELTAYEGLKNEFKSFQHFNIHNKLYLPTDQILEDFNLFRRVIKANTFTNDYFWAYRALNFLKKTKTFYSLNDARSAIIEIIALKEKHKVTGFTHIDEGKRDVGFGLDFTSAFALKELFDDLNQLPKSHWRQTSGQNGIFENMFTQSRVNFVDVEMIHNAKDKHILAILLLDKIFTESKEAVIKAREQNDAVLSSIDQLKHTFIFIDEVQNFAPVNPKSPHEVLLGDIIHQIAAEGRKYGIHLVMGTQRPNKVKQGLLGECDNAIIMKMNSRSDLEKLSSEMRILDVKLLENCIYFQGTGNAFAVGEMTGIAPFTRLFKSAPRRTLEGGTDIKDF